MSEKEPVRRRTQLSLPDYVDLEEQDPGYLLGMVQILGRQHNVELIEVRSCPMDDRGQRQKAINPIYQRQLDRIYAVAGEGVDQLEAIELDGHTYVLVIEPGED